MESAAAGQVILGLLTGGVAWTLGATLLRRRVAPVAEDAHTGLALFWLGYGAVFVQLSAILLLRERLDAATSGLLLLQLSAVALCFASGGILVHAGYLLRGRVRLIRLAALWGLVLGLLLVAAVLVRPVGIVEGPGGPHVAFADDVPLWLGPAAGLVLAAPILLAAWVYGSARHGLADGAARARATLKTLSLYLAAAWLPLSATLVATPALAREPWLMMLARLLGLAAPGLALGAELVRGARHEAPRSAEGPRLAE